MAQLDGWDWRGGRERSERRECAQEREGQKKKKVSAKLSRLGRKLVAILAMPGI